MKYLNLKYILSGLMSVLFTVQCLAVANPSVLGADISPAPVVYPGGTATFQFQINNTGSATSSQFVTVEISFSNLDFANSTFNVATDVAQTQGNTPFTWSYNAGVKTLTGTLNGNFAQLSSNTFQIRNLNVLASNSDMSNPSTGGNVNVVAPGAVNSNLNDDNTNSRTYTSAALLPVELLLFKATKLGGCEAQVLWASGEESNLNYYQLEASTDGKSFSEAGNVQKNKGRNSKYEQTTQLNAAKSNYTYYRLKMVDTDKSIKYSEIISINNDCAKKNKSTLLITPNPANNTIQVKEFNSKGIMYIYDMTGRLVLTAAISEAGNQQIDIADLTRGTYLIKLTSDEGMYYSKMVKQ